MEDENDPERSYRRGYTHGAWHVIEALKSRLSPADQQRLESWFTEHARKWRLAAYEGTSQRGTNGEITAAITPPIAELQLLFPN